MNTIDTTICLLIIAVLLLALVVCCLGFESGERAYDIRFTRMVVSEVCNDEDIMKINTRLETINKSRNRQGWTKWENIQLRGNSALEK